MTASQDAYWVFGGESAHTPAVSVLAFLHEACTRGSCQARTIMIRHPRMLHQQFLISGHTTGEPRTCNALLVPCAVLYGIARLFLACLPNTLRSTQDNYRHSFYGAVVVVHNLPSWTKRHNLQQAQPPTTWLVTPCLAFLHILPSAMKAQL
jgi:hypothetical protein